MNVHIIVGRLGADPELKELSNGNSVTSFSVATTKRWVKDGEKQEKTTWHKIKAFGKQGEVIHKFLKKGSMISLQGSSEVDVVEKDGETKRYHYTRLDRFDFVSGRAGDSQDAKAAKTETPAKPTVKNHAPTFDESEDLPF